MVQIAICVCFYITIERPLVRLKHKKHRQQKMESTQKDIATLWRGLDKTPNYNIFQRIQGIFLGFARKLSGLAAVAIG